MDGPFLVGEVIFPIKSFLWRMDILSWCSQVSTDSSWRAERPSRSTGLVLLSLFFGVPGTQSYHTLNRHIIWYIFGPQTV